MLPAAATNRLHRRSFRSRDKLPAPDEYADKLLTGGELRVLLAVVAEIRMAVEERTSAVQPPPAMLSSV